MITGLICWAISYLVLGWCGSVTQENRVLVSYLVGVIAVVGESIEDEIRESRRTRS